ncbi:MAG: helix-turn-helix domain-containing protein [Paracoccaceae bacterium]
MTDAGGKLRYDEGCLGAHALNVMGDRWALLVVRELIFTSKRFQMLRAGMPGITASVLTQRLTQLREAGVVHHDERLGIYALTDLGRGLMPVLESLCQWALTLPGHDPTRFISPSSLMISMRVALKQPGEALAGFDFGAEAFQVRVTGTGLHTQAVATPKAPFILKGSGNAMAFTLYGPAPLIDMIAQGAVSAEGDLAAAQYFIDRFRLDRTP